MSSLVEATVAWLRRTGCVEIRTATHVKAVTKTNAPTTTVQTKKGKNAASEEGSKERETSSGSGNTTLTVHLSDGTTIEADHVVSALPARCAFFGRNLHSRDSTVVVKYVSTFYSYITVKCAG
jgi:protoporphyrinogen oxidase